MKKQAKAGRRKPAASTATRRATAQGWTSPDEKMYKPIKRPVTLRLDADVLAWFKTQGRGYQTRINRALRAVMTKERKAG